MSGETESWYPDEDYGFENWLSKADLKDLIECLEQYLIPEFNKKSKPEFKDANPHNQFSYECVNSGILAVCKKIVKILDE